MVDVVLRDRGRRQRDARRDVRRGEAREPLALAEQRREVDGVSGHRRVVEEGRAPEAALLDLLMTALEPPAPVIHISLSRPAFSIAEATPSPMSSSCV